MPTIHDRIKRRAAAGVALLIARKDYDAATVALAEANAENQSAQNDLNADMAEQVSHEVARLMDALGE